MDNLLFRPTGGNFVEYKHGNRSHKHFKTLGNLFSKIIPLILNFHLLKIVVLHLTEILGNQLTFEFDELDEVLKHDVKVHVV